jgi:hypothetical protein
MPPEKVSTQVLIGYSKEERAGMALERKFWLPVGKSQWKRPARLPGITLNRADLERAVFAEAGVITR